MSGTYAKKFIDLNLKELKNNFIQSISELYPSEELQSFFNLLSEKYLNLTRIEIALHPDKEVSEENKKIFEDAIQRLQQFEPIQYILSETEFYGLHFLVNKNVLIPRPETEELVDWVLESNPPLKGAKGMLSNKQPKTILDIGTGSGCIAISLAHSLPNALVSAIDISEGALYIAKENAIANNVSVNFQLLDILKFNHEPWNLVFNNLKFDTIVSNPPYIREQEKSQIEPNVIKHEPALALFVEDSDPLLFYRKIAQFSQKYLKPDGTLFFEINEYLSDDLYQMLSQEGFVEIEIRNDIFGKDRMVKCKKDEKIR